MPQHGISQAQSTEGYQGVNRGLVSSICC